MNMSVEGLVTMRHGGLSLTKSIIGIIAITFFAELIVMAALTKLGYMYSSEAIFVVSAVVLSALVVPSIYLLVLYPIKQAYNATHKTIMDLGSADPAQRDPLTQVLTQRAITIDLLEAIAQAERYGKDLTLAMVDVDHLQQINKQQGKEAGDQVMQTVAATLTEVLRMPDRIGRYGEDEFLLALPETVVEDAATITNRIRSSVSELEMQGSAGTFNATISIGITEYNKGEDIQHVLSRLEQAIAEAKAKGSNLVITKTK